MLNATQIQYLDSLTIRELFNLLDELLFKHQSCVYGLSARDVAFELAIRVSIQAQKLGGN